MYTISISKKLIAKHYLPFESGKEEKKHSHNYIIQILLSGEKLDEHGFVFDIIQIHKILDRILKHFRNKTLNTMSEFRGKTASIENFSKIIWDMLLSELKTNILKTIEVRIWENDSNWASYKGDITQ